jgi:hypothetical protein
MADKRLTLKLLEAIVKATEGGQVVRSTDMALRGWAQEQVWLGLSAVMDEGLIRAKRELRDLQDHPDDPSLLIEGLTAAGWAVYDELRSHPVRRWITRHSGLIMVLATVAVVVVGVLSIFL